MLENLEAQLDSFDGRERKDALVRLCSEVESGRLDLPDGGDEVNLHCHTFFSYNTYGYSPSKFAWLGRKRGLAVAGIVDFDVLDGLDEFYEASRLLGLKGCAGLETRVFVPEFADKVMTSPGEPGITYHMGVGFPSSRLGNSEQEFLVRLKQTAQQRNRDLTGRVNEHLKPVELDYERDVVSLTPAGNPTERHISLAFARKAREVFSDDGELAAFWSDKLGVDAEPLGLPEGRDLLNAIRAKTMKRGGVGYVQPDAGAFPTMEDANRFVLAAGGIPTLTWLDGTADGEQEIERLIEIAKASGVAAINIIPDRNYTPGIADEKARNLNDVVDLAEQLSLPVVVGTEMNSPGQKFVDDFSSDELSRWMPVFLKGAYIVYAHSVLERMCGLGYLSDWAKQNFADVAVRNEFFETIGRKLDPSRDNAVGEFSVEGSPDQLLNLLSN